MSKVKFEPPLTFGVLPSLWVSFLGSNLINGKPNQLLEDQ